MRVYKTGLSLLETMVSIALLTLLLSFLFATTIPILNYQERNLRTTEVESDLLFIDRWLTSLFALSDSIQYTTQPSPTLTIITQSDDRYTLGAEAHAGCLKRPVCHVFQYRRNDEPPLPLHRPQLTLQAFSVTQEASDHELWSQTVTVSFLLNETVFSRTYLLPRP
jgi:type II secretory pathway component PulJ